MFFHICLQIYILLYLIIYKRGVSGVLGVAGALGGVGGSCCPRWCPRCGGVVSSVVWCPRWCGVGVLGGVSGVLGGGGVGVLGGVSGVLGGVVPSVVWMVSSVVCLVPSVVCLVSSVVVVSGVLGGVGGPFRAGAVVPGVLGGVLGVVVPSVAYMQPPPRRARTRLLSAAALSLLNRSFKVELTSAIALIINYLGVPFRICFTKQERVKKLITSEIQRINHLKNNNLQENIIYLEFSYKTRKTTKVLLNSIIFKKNTII